MLLKRLPFKFSETKHRELITFQISNKQLWAYLKEFGNSYTKYIPKEIKELSQELLKIFLKWYLIGDGCIKRAGTSQKEISCYTVSEKLKEDLQEISLKIGSNISIQEKNKLIFLRRKTVKLKGSMRIVDYKGMIYGIEVKKNHTLCIKRNEKIVFSGNSLRDYGEATNTIWDGDENCGHEFEVVETKRPNASGGKTEYAKQKLSIKGMDNYSEFVDYHNRVTKSSFCRKCGAWCGQLGLEPTLDLYHKHMLQITSELKRILKKDGIMFWNHGDNYASSRGYSDPKYPNGRTGEFDEPSAYPQGNIKPKSLFMQNYRLILKMIDEQGWILRNVIIWHKINHMPSSVTDRFSNAYEPVFMLTKSKKYWFDLDAVRAPHTSNVKTPKHKYTKGEPPNATYANDVEYNPLGKNPGDVWKIPTQPFPEAHFATFPEKLVEPMIKSGCPQWICKKCRKARERIVKVHRPPDYDPSCIADYADKVHPNWHNRPVSKIFQDTLRSKRKTVGWTDCGCNAGWDSGIVLDPFAGSGTTLLVARKLLRDYIGIELNPEYIKIAKKRIYKIPERLDKFIERI